MATNTRPCGPFGKLSLSLDGKKDLCRMAKGLVRELLDSYERFLWKDNETLSSVRWSTLREREDVHVYHDRRPGAGTEDKDLQVLMTIGTVVGELNDAMYGVLNHTTDATRLKTAYTNDTLLDCAVLSTVQEPKTDKPFRSLTVKWLVKKVPLAARAVTKHRDLVCLEATGMTHLSTGEQVGYYVLHSIKLSQTPPLAAYTRGGLSTCGIWKQQTPERVQVYMRSYVDVPERILAPLIIRSAADAFVSLWRYMHCAQMKKLAWLMRRKTPLLEAAQPKSPYAPEPCCAVCESQSPTARQGAKSVCVICNRRVCPSCRVKRDLCSILPDNQLISRRVAFCVPCLAVAVRADAADVARDEIPGTAAASATLSALVRVVGTRSSCPVVTDDERLRDRERRSLSSSGGSSTGRKASSASHPFSLQS